MVTSRLGNGGQFRQFGPPQDEDEDLLLQSSGQLLLSWEKIRGLVPALRAAPNKSRLYLEAEATGMDAYREQHWPEPYESFAEMARNVAR